MYRQSSPLAAEDGTREWPSGGVERASDVQERRLADGYDVEAEVEQRLVVQDVAAHGG